MEDGKKGPHLFGILGIVLSVFVTGAKLCRLADPPRSYAPTAYQDLLPEPFATGPTEPVVFALEIGGQSIDVEGDTIEIAGQTARVEWSDEVTFTHEDVAFEHASSMQVSVEGGSDPFEILGTVDGGALLRISPVRGRATPSRVAQYTIESLVTAGATRSPEVPTIELGSTRISGTRLAQTATGMTIDVYPIAGAVPAVVSYFRPTSAPEDPGLARVVGSLRRPADDAPAAPDLTLLMDATRIPLSVDVPVVLPTAQETTVTLRRRATVRRTLSGVTFEHDGTASASETIDALAPRVLLNGSGASVQVLVVRDATPEFLISGLTSSLPNATPWQTSSKVFGHDSWSALSGLIRVGEDEVRTDVYARSLRGYTLALLVQYPEENAEAALALATTVATTARVR